MSTVRWARGTEKLLVPMSELEQHPFNPNEGALSELIESIKVNGFNTVITVDAKTNYIIAGNHRYQALHALGETHIPVVYADHMEDQGVRYLVADNRIGKKAITNESEEAELLKGLAASEIGLIGTGWDDVELNDLLTRLQEEQDMPIDPQGFGGEPGLNGVFQCVIEFDNADDRDECVTSITDAYPDFYGKIRSVTL